MNMSLKDFAKTGGKKVEYKFLKPLAEVLESKYKGITSVVDNKIVNYNALTEAIFEIVSESSLVRYSTPEKLKAVVNVYETYTDRDGKIKFEVSNGRELFEAIYKKSSYGYFNTTMEDVYVVTDGKAFEEYCFAEMEAAENARLEEAKKASEERTNNVKAEVADRKEFNVKGTVNRNAMKLAKLLSAATLDKPALYEALSSMV